MKLTSFLATLSIGVIAGLLLAPKKGEELREDLVNKTKETYSSLKDMTREDLEFAFNKAVDDIKVSINEFDVNKFKASTADKIKEAETKLNEIKVKLEGVLESVRSSDYYKDAKDSVSKVSKDVVKKVGDIKAKITDNDFTSLAELDDEIDEVDEELDVVIKDLKNEEE